MKKEFEINGYIEVPIDVSEKEFFEKFIHFIESNSWSFAGMTNEIIDDECMTKSLYDPEVEKKGIQKGIEQGIEQGAREKAIEIAKLLLDVLDTKTIAAKTGLTLEEVEQLKNTKDEQYFYKQQLKEYQREGISPAELEEIKNLDRLEWQEDATEQIIADVIEKSLHEEKINLARSLFDVLDDETIAQKTGLDINFIKALKVEFLKNKQEKEIFDIMDEVINENKFTLDELSKEN